MVKAGVLRRCVVGRQKGRLRLAAFATRVCLVGSCVTSEALAQQEGQKSEDDANNSEIVVTATAADGTLIDRETYFVRDTPLAQTKSAVEVIQNLPSVSVDGSGQLRLLGNRSVKVLIDGRDVPNAQAVLANLQASQIARVEVMTNPSAQYSAYGSAGIINIILRRKFADGLGGSGSVTTGNSAHVATKLSPTWSGGKWSIAASPSLSTTDSPNNSYLERSFTEAKQPLGRIEEQTGRGTSRSAAATAQLSFRHSPAERYDLTGSLTHARGTSERVIDISSPVNAFAPFRQAGEGRSALDSRSISVERTRTGNRSGEELKMSLSWSQYELSGRNSYVDELPAGLRHLLIATTSAASDSGIKADYTVQLGKSDTLSIGAEASQERHRFTYFAAGYDLSDPFHMADEFAGRSFDVSAFGTLQTQIGALKILPGLRMQTRRFKFPRRSGVDPVAGTLIFPSLHLEQRIRRFTGTFSVAARADWPAIPQFQPITRVTGPTTVETGNPDLRPERTVNVETGGRISIAKQDLSMKLYHRRRSAVRDTIFTVTEAGDVLTTPVNVGSRLSQGGQLTVRGSWPGGWRYSASGWVAMARYNVLEEGGLIREEAAEHGANAQLEYSRGKQDTVGFQQASVNVRYQGATRTYQTRISPLLTIDLNYTRNVTDRLAMVGTVSRAFGHRSISVVRSAAEFREISVSELYSPVVRFSLAYRFGTRR